MSIGHKNLKRHRYCCASMIIITFKYIIGVIFILIGLSTWSLFLLAGWDDGQ